MDASHQHLPYEVVDIIIGFASDLSLRTASWDTLPRQTLLVCALVCNAWLWPARCRFLSLYCKLGVVSLDATPQAFHKLHDVFTSPLCTLDPTFIRALEICSRFSKVEVVPFSTLLYILTRISFPSLHTIRFHGIYPNFNDLNVEGEDYDNGTSSVVTGVPQVSLPQVRELVISASVYNRSRPSALGFIAKSTQLFPCLESLTVLDQYDIGIFNQNGDVCSLPPPQSLRKLVVQTSTIMGLAKWLAACGHTSISSISLQGAEYMEERVLSRLLLVLHTFGHGLEELELGMGCFIFWFNTQLNPLPTLDLYSICYFLKQKFAFKKSRTSVPLKRLVL